MEEEGRNNPPSVPPQSGSIPRHQARLEVRLDGGWGWVVVVSSFLVSAVVDGVGFTVGVFFSSLQKEFGSNNQQTSWVSSVLNGTYLVIGPVVSACLNQYSIRKVASFGCMLAALAFSFSTLSPNIEVLIIIYGLFGGIGLGFLYQPSVVIVGYYFVKRRGLALGITSCGSGIGAFAFAPLFSFCVSSYGWKAAAYLSIVLVLLCLGACATFKPVGSMVSITHSQNSRQKNSISSESSRMAVIVESRTTPNPQNEREEVSSLEVFERKTSTKGKSTVDTQSSALSAIDTRGASGSFLKSSVSVTEIHISKSDSEFAQSQNARVGNTVHVTSSAENVSFKDHQTEVIKTKDGKLSIDLSTIDMLQGITFLPVNQKQPKITQNVVNRNLNDDVSLRKYTSGVSQSTESTIKCYFTRWLWLPFRENICLMRKPCALFYGIACFLMSLGMYVPTTFLPPMAVHLGFESSKGALFVSTIGIGNVVARLMSGMFGDRWPRCVLPINITALLLAGLCTTLVPFFTTFSLILFYSFLFGACIGAVVALQVVVLIDLLGQDHLNNAFGIINMYHGLGTFLGPPLAGFIWDVTGDVHNAFYVIGVLLLFSGVICIPLPFLNTSGCYKVKQSTGTLTI